MWWSVVSFLSIEAVLSEMSQYVQEQLSNQDSQKRPDESTDDGGSGVVDSSCVFIHGHFD